MIGDPDDGTGGPALQAAQQKGGAQAEISGDHTDFVRGEQGIQPVEILIAYESLHRRRSHIWHLTPLVKGLQSLQIGH